MKVRLATAEDGAAIARLITDTPMDGAMRTAFAYSDSFFDGLAVEGTDPVVCVAEESGHLLGVGASTARRVHLGGRTTGMRYLGALRLAQQARCTSVLPRGFALLRGAFEARDEELFLTCILDDNEPARKTLLGARAGLPPYEKVAQLVTYVMPTASMRSPAATGAARDATPHELASFLRDSGMRRPLFPVCEPCDLAGAGGAFPGLSAGDFSVLRKDGRLIGALACWDTRSARRIRVTGYRGSLRWLRPLVNLAGRCAGTGRLPRPGADLAACYATLGAMQDSSAGVFETLLHAAGTVAARRGCAWLIATVDARDTERRDALESLRSRQIHSTLYEVRLRKSRPTGWPPTAPLHVVAALL